MIDDLEHLSNVHPGLVLPSAVSTWVVLYSPSISVVVNGATQRDPTHHFILFRQVLLIQLPQPTDDFPWVSNVLSTATRLPTSLLPLSRFLIILQWCN
jgi:hypothetical protein